MNNAAKVEAVLKNVDSHGLYPASAVERWLKEVGLNIKVPKGWKVTKQFIKEVERSGGYCSMTLGTPMLDGAGVLSMLMNHFKVSPTMSYGGRGKQFHSDWADLQKALSDREVSPTTTKES